MYCASASAAHGITVGDRPPPRRAAPHRLAVPDMARPEPAELRAPAGLRREVRHIQHRRLAAPQPPPVDHLEQRRVPERGQPPLAPRRRPPARRGRRPRRGTPAAHSRVSGRRSGRPSYSATCTAVLPSWHTWTGRAPTRCLALGRPAIPRIARVVQERRQRPLIQADRRMRPPAGGDPLLDLRRRPLPRPGPGELREPAHQADPPLDERPGQPPACCCRCHPSSIASNSAGPPRTGHPRPS